MCLLFCTSVTVYQYNKKKKRMKKEEEEQITCHSVQLSDFNLRSFIPKSSQIVSHSHYLILYGMCIQLVYECSSVFSYRRGVRFACSNNELCKLMVFNMQCHFEKPSSKYIYQGLTFDRIIMNYGHRFELARSDITRF